MVSKCAHSQEADASTPQLFVRLPVTLTLDDLGILSVMMIILWTRGVGILQEADPSTPPTMMIILWSRFAHPTSSRPPYPLPFPTSSPPVTLVYG